MMDVNDLIFETFLLFSEGKYAEALKKLHQAWDGITDKSTQITEQIEIQSWFGDCYLEQARRTKNRKKAGGDLCKIPQNPLNSHQDI